MAGVGLLQRHTSYASLPETRRKNSPFVAGLLSLLVPGLGAAYNGQTSKAVFHFALFASFFQLGAMTNGIAIFVWAAFCTWLYATVDAYRTAQLIRAGLAPKDEEEAIARRLYSNPLAWGVVLVVLGALITLRTFFNLNLLARDILPLILVAIGGSMIFSYLRRRQKKNNSAATMPSFENRPPLSVIDAGTTTANGSERALRTPDFTKTEFSARSVERLPFKS